MREVYRVNQSILMDLFRDRPDVLTLMVLYRADMNSTNQIRQDLPAAMEELRHRLR